MDLGLDGRTAIVTGASRGIGRAIAGTIAAEGAAVFLVARDGERLATAASEIVGAGGVASTLAIDLTDPTAAARVVEQCTADLGRVDILVNNAGGAHPSPLAALTDADWRRDLELNFLSAARLAVACTPTMRAAGWGRMVHVGSTSARRPDPLFAPYSAAKAALANLSVALSVELAADGVTSNCVVAGVTETDLIRENAARSANRLDTTVADVLARQLARTAPPAGRFGTPDEVAAAVAFLVSDQAAWITGATVAVDGGTLRAV